MSVNFAFRIRAGGRATHSQGRCALVVAFIFKLHVGICHSHWGTLDASSLRWYGYLSLLSRSRSLSPSLSFRMTTRGVVALLAAVSIRTDLQMQPSVKRRGRRVAEDLQCRRCWSGLPITLLRFKVGQEDSSGGGIRRFPHFLTWSVPYLPRLSEGQATRQTWRALSEAKQSSHIKLGERTLNTQTSGKCGCIHHGGLYHFEETYFARLYLCVGALRSVKNLFSRFLIYSRACISVLFVHWQWHIHLRLLE